MQHIKKVEEIVELICNKDEAEEVKNRKVVQTFDKAENPDVGQINRGIQKHYIYYEELCKTMKQRDILTLTLINDCIPISILQLLINKNAAIGYPVDYLDKKNCTPLKKALSKDFNSLTKTQQLKLFLYFYNTRILYALEVEKSSKSGNKNAQSINLTNCSKLSPFGSALVLFVSALDAKKEHFLNSIEFKNEFLQQRIKDAKNHGAFDNKVIENKKSPLRANGFNEDKVKEWEQNLIRAREEYSLEKFLTKNRSKSADKRDLDQNYNNYGFHSPQSDLGEKRSLVDRDSCLTLKKRKASHQLETERIGSASSKNTSNIQAAETSQSAQAPKTEFWRPWEPSTNDKSFSAGNHCLKSCNSQKIQDYISNTRFCTEKEPEKRLNSPQLSKHIDHCKCNI